MLRHAFTLIELLVAMAVGLVLVLIGMVILRSTVQTVTLANRLGLENRLMRQGAMEALDELDYWTIYDDPLDAGNQKLRTVTAMPAAPTTASIGDGWGGIHVWPDDGVTNQPSAWSRMKLGLAFSPLANVPVPLINDFSQASEAGRAVGARVRGVTAGSSDYRTMLLAPVSALVDDASQAAGAAYELDRDRGFDPQRPYQANDPRRWYRGNVYETPHSDKRFGRYGMLMNLWQEPMLGYGSDPREPMAFGRSVPAGMPPGHQGVTGPYGPYPAGDYAGHAMQSRTWTWYCNQVVFLWEALGNFGVAEYLPSGAIINSYGTRVYHPKSTPEYTEPYLSATTDPAGPTIRLTVRDASKQDDNHMRIDERQDIRFAGFPCFWGYAGTDGRSNIYHSRIGSHVSKPGTMWDATRDATHPLLPISPYTGAAIVGMPMAGWGWDDIYGDNGGNPGPNTSLRPETIALYHRMAWAGNTSQSWIIRPLENRSQTIVPLMPQKPADWPELQMGVQRLIFNGRITAVARVRWSDPVTGEIAELGITSVATSLRGARQQRKPSGGWAVFYGVNDPRNDATLDSP